MAVKLSPLYNEATLDSSGNPWSGAKLFTYTAGSTTKQTAYQDSAGSSAHTNPIVLNSRGEPPAAIWLTSGVSYKFVLTSPTDSDPPVASTRTVDNVSGINDTTVAQDEWVSGPTPTFVSTTSFTLVGDQTTTFNVGRRVKTTNSGGTIYSTISATAFTSLTTVTVENDSGVLDSGLSAVSYALVSGANTSAPLLSDAFAIIGGSADRSKKYRHEVDGFPAATTIVGTPAPYAHRIGNLPAGIIVPYAGSSLPATGWLECDGTAVSRTTYADLFTAISTTWGVGNGTTTFNVPDFRDKVPIGSGTGTVKAAGVDAGVDIGADTLTVASNNTKWTTGMTVVFTLTSGTITGLVHNTTYYVVRDSATTIKLASSLANAQNGTVIDFTAKASPVWDITHTYTARTLGEYGGEESHAMSSVEHLAHGHTGSTGTVPTLNSAGTAGGNNTLQELSDASNGTAPATLTIASTGGNAAMNTMQPFGVVKYIISH
jgi:microcystin-dependent protein